LWKRAAKLLRSLAYRGLTALDHVAPWRNDPLLPPAHLRIYYYRTWKPDAFARACRGARNELDVAGLRPKHRVLDIGSGIGNLAVGLIGYLQGTYDGIEVHREAVAWCRRAITPRHPTDFTRPSDQRPPSLSMKLHSTLARRIGLGIRDVRRGGWWRGVSHDQDVIVAVPASY
jgi:hypothetical protein